MSPSPRVPKHSLVAWGVGSALCFSLAGVLALVATDLSLPSVERMDFLQRLRFAREPGFLLSVSVPPALAAVFAYNRWIFHGSKFFRGWASVAAAAWLSLVFNPGLFFLVMATFTVFGWIAFALIFATGAMVGLAWRFAGPQTLMRSQDEA